MSARGDPLELAGVVKREQAVERALPDACRRLQALAYDPREELSGTGMWSALAWNSRTNSSGSGSASGRMPSWTSSVTSLSAVMEEPMNASRATRFGRMGNPPGDEGAHRMADQGRPGDADRVHECHHVGGELVDRVAVGRTLRIAEAAQVNGVGVVRGRQ